MRYNFQSDLKIVEPIKAEAPFRFTYFVNVGGKSLVAEYDGSKYSNCFPRDGELIIPVDGKSLGIGEVKVKREYFLNDADFSDGICTLVTVTTTGIELWHGESDSAEEVRVDVAPYYNTIVDIPNGSVTEDKLSEEVKNKLNSTGGGYEPPVGGIPKQDLSSEVQASLSKADTALQEHQSLDAYAKKSDVPNKVSQLTNDSNYTTLSKVQAIANGLVTKEAHTSDIQGLQAEVDNLEAAMITAEEAQGEEVTDYVLMSSDIAQELTDDENKVASSKAVKSAIESIEDMIVSVINTPI